MNHLILQIIFLSQFNHKLPLCGSHCSVLTWNDSTSEWTLCQMHLLLSYLCPSWSPWFFLPELPLPFLNYLHLSVLCLMIILDIFYEENLKTPPRRFTLWCHSIYCRTIRGLQWIKTSCKIQYPTHFCQVHLIVNSKGKVFSLPNFWHSNLYNMSLTWLVPWNANSWQNTNNRGVLKHLLA